MQEVTNKDGAVSAKFAPTMDQIRQLEVELSSHPHRLMDLKVVHHFSPGMYAREMHIPAGVMATGKIHKTEHLCTLSAGEFTVWTENAAAVRLAAPCTFVSHVGAKRVVFANTDVVFTTYHPNPTNETDVAALEEMMVVQETPPPMIEGQA